MKNQILNDLIFKTLLTANMPKYYKLHTYKYYKADLCIKSEVIYKGFISYSIFPQSVKCSLIKIPYFLQNLIPFCTSSKAAISIYPIDLIATSSFQHLKQERMLSLQALQVVQSATLLRCRRHLLLSTTFQPIETCLPPNPFLHRPLMLLPTQECNIVRLYCLSCISVLAL